MPEQDVGQVREIVVGEGDMAFSFQGQTFRSRAEANRARQNEVRLRSIESASASAGAGARGGAGEGASAGLRGQEFRTDEQLRAEGELAKQLDKDRLSEVKPPESLETVKMEVDPLKTASDQFMTTTDKLLGETPEATVTEAAPAVQVAEAPVLAAPQGVAPTVAGQEKEMTAATLEAPTRVIDPDDIEGTVSAESIATAQTAELDERALLTFQLDQLFLGFKPGQVPPPWATAPIRRVASLMASRGLGASSMAAAAQVQAIMEAGIPLAREDAQRYATIQLQNLSHKQQTALANAAVYAAMDQTNVGVRLQSQIENSRSFLAIDTANLTNRQQEEALNQQARNQFLLADQAARAAMEQLNVRTMAETDQFFSQLGSQIRENNANRITAVEQFNAGQKNTISVFNAKQKDLRERFNSEMRAGIQASNVEYNRARETLRNRNQMLVNEFNARAVNQATSVEYAAQYLDYRDTATRIFATVEGNENRATQLAIGELQASATRGSGGGKSGILGSLIGAAGSIGAALITAAPCHVAQEVYGTETNDWIKFRHWMYHDSPKWFKKLYMTYSLPASKFISDKPLIKRMIKYFMDKQVRKVNWNA